MIIWWWAVDTGGVTTAVEPLGQQQIETHRSETPRMSSVGVGILHRLAPSERTERNAFQTGPRFGEGRLEIGRPNRNNPPFRRLPPPLPFYPELRECVPCCTTYAMPGKRAHTFLPTLTPPLQLRGSRPHFFRLSPTGLPPSSSSSSQLIRIIKVGATAVNGHIPCPATPLVALSLPDIQLNIPAR
jgi:hypothetical protein